MMSPIEFQDHEPRSDHGKGRVAESGRMLTTRGDHEFEAGNFEESKDLRRYLFDVENLKKASEGCAGFAMSDFWRCGSSRTIQHAVELSPLFAWWNARFLEGEAGQNNR